VEPGARDVQARICGGPGWATTQVFPAHRLHTEFAQAVRYGVHGTPNINVSDGRPMSIGCPSPCPALTGVVPFRCSTAPRILRKLRPLCKRPIISQPISRLAVSLSKGNNHPLQGWDEIAYLGPATTPTANPSLEAGD